MVKKCICLGVCIATALSLSGCARQDNGLEKLRLNEVVHSVFYAPQYVALELGFFEDEGLQIELDVGQGADRSMTALISGEADIALLGIEAGIYVFNEGRENFAVPFAQLTQRAGNYLVSRTDDKDFKWDDVIGKSIIGGRPGGMPQMILEYVLKQNGIKPGDDVEIITNLQFTSTAGAFAGGEGDYTVEFDPSALALEHAGHGYVVASLGLESGKVPYTVYMATKDYISNNKGTVQRFTNAIYRGQLWVNEHSAAEIATVIAPQFPDSDLESLTIMVGRYKAQDTWKNDLIIDEEGFLLIQDIMEHGGVLSERVPFEGFINTDFANGAANMN